MTGACDIGGYGWAMCGRYVATTTAEGLVKFFVVDDRQAGDLPPNYNVAPTDQVPAILRHDGQLVLSEFRWGLVPFWAKDPRMGAGMINARSETVADKNAFAESFERRRCLLPADGFYEWEKVADGTKRGARLPWFVRRTDGDPMVYAGIWSSWRDRATPDAPRLLTCSILTTTANGVLNPIHDRMPVLLRREQWDAWLDPQSDLGDLQELLGPAPEEDVERFRVSTRVNSVANNDAELLTRLAEDDRDLPSTVATPRPVPVDQGQADQGSLF